MTSAELTSEIVISKLLDVEPSPSGGEAFLGKKFKPKKTQKDNKGQKKGCFECGSTSHFRRDCPRVKKPLTSKQNGVAKNAWCALLSTKSNDWIIDSGASSHMPPHGNILKNAKSSNIAPIVSANNEKMEVKKVGDASVIVNNGEITMNNVLYIPDLACNLLSVHKIVQKGNTVKFDKKGFTITNDHNKVLFSGKAENGVYPIKETKCLSLLCGREVDAITWHRRLGHLSYGKMLDLQKGKFGVVCSNSETEIKNCSVCAFGKQTRKPFKKSESVTSEILELVHSDLVGPMETQSIGKSRYILTFIDDFSRKVFVYFLKSKEEVLIKFSEFKQMVETQTERKVKAIRTDNGTEYCNNEFNKFCKRNGIRHEKTAPYTPEQNGVAERMNRTLVEMAKCMLFDADLPKRFWAEATGMAAFIQNRVIKGDGRVPYEVFSDKTVDFSNLRIFGTSVMVHVPKQKRKK